MKFTRETRPDRSDVGIASNVITSIEACGCANVPRLFLPQRRYLLWIIGLSGVFASSLAFAEGDARASLWCGFSLWMLLSTCVKNVTLLDNQIKIDFYMFAYRLRIYDVKIRSDFYSATSLGMNRYVVELVPVYFVLSPIRHDVIINPIFLKEVKDVNLH